jgi:hypothetical protein
MSVNPLFQGSTDSDLRVAIKESMIGIKAYGILLSPT